jgi:monoamine oxidase
MSLTVIVGAGAAGLAAGLELEARGLPFLILEARDRIGGRAHTIEQNGLALDLGCEWLHHAETNSWRKRFEALGMTIDRRPAAWDRIADQTTFSKAEQADYHRAFAALEARIEEAAEARDDRAVGELMPPDCRWNPLLNAFSAAYNGAAFPQISVKDYAAYDDGRENWRVGGGYGAAIAAASRRLPVRLNAPVTRIEHGGRTLRVLGPFGAVAATSVIVTVPTPLLANGALMFDPPLLGKQEAAAHLPLGHVTKVFIRLSGAAASGDESMLYTEPLGPEPATLFLRTAGRPLAELYVGGDLAVELERVGAAAAADFAIERLVQAFGADLRRQVEPLASTDWSGDPWSLGAYSYAQIGRHAARQTLAEPVGDRLFFAGEATHSTMFSTAHGAHDTGVAAARKVAAKHNDR